MFNEIIIINREVRKMGIPGIVLVEENLVEEIIGIISMKVKLFCRLIEGHMEGWKKTTQAKGSLQNRGVEIEERGLIAGSKEVKRSGVILISLSRG